MSLTAALRDWNKLNTFMRVAERRNLTQAAADLRTTSSVVSKRMRELEEVPGQTAPLSLSAPAPTACVATSASPAAP